MRFCVANVVFYVFLCVLFPVSCYFSSFSVVMILLGIGYALVYNAKLLKLFRWKLV